MKRRIVVLMVALFTAALFSQTTGVIRGVVLDEMGEPLPGANVTVVGTTWGAETDDDGYYYMIGVRAGTYTLTAQFIGFMPREVQDVRVRVGLTTTQNFRMTTEVMELAEIGVEVAMERRVEMDVTTSIRSVDTGVIENLAVTQVGDVLRQTAGVQTDADGELHFRGGRAGEVNYMIDGVSVGDPTGSRSNPVEINFANIESFNIQKGVPDAEYGDALSGTVNIVMRVGDQTKTSGHAKYTTDSFFGNNKLNYDRGEFSLSGPIPLPMTGMKPTYFIGTDFTLQDGFSRSYRVNGDPEGDYFQFKDHDLTGFGFEMPQRRVNNFNFTLRSAYDVSLTKRLTVSYMKNRWNSHGYSWGLRYNPEIATMSTEDVTIFNMNWRHTINQQSYYDLVFSYFNRKAESLPAGMRPDEFVFDKDLDQFPLSYAGFETQGRVITFDIIPNGVRDGGDAEGYIDINQNGYFDREFFIVNTEVNDPPFEGNYRPGIDTWEPYNPLYDHNMNGVYDGDYLYDSNGNNAWDYWEAGLSFTGFGDDVFYNRPDFHIVEGYIDVNMNGHYDEPNLYVGSRDEPYIDGDIFNDTGEPFIDQLRFARQGNTIVERANGRWDDDTTITFIIEDEIGGVPVDYTETFDGFWERLEEIVEIYKATYRTYKVVDSDDLIERTFVEIKYPQEEFADLRSSLGSTTQTTPRLNDIYNGPNGYFDEYEAFTSWRPAGELQVGQAEEALGWSQGTDENGVEYIQYVGSYVIYKAPLEIHNNPPNWAELPYIPGYSTWIDTNNNGFYDRPDGQYNPGESFVDYNNDGVRNLNDGFIIPGRMVTNMRYADMNNTVMKLKGAYTNQISRFHLLKAGFEFTFNDFDYYEFYNPQFYRDPAQYGTIENDPYPDRGDWKTQYNYKPKEFSAFLQDKMEFEDLVVNAGVRFDLRVLPEDAVEYYEERYNSTGSDQFGYEEKINKYTAAISPRLGISHSISESSKLFFSYGHLYQIPHYTYIFDPDTKVGGGVFGNMNLGFERNVQYELGVVNEVGDYLIDITGYFKDIYDMINTKSYDYGIVQKSIWYNSDYGKTRGIEISVDRGLKNNYLWGLSYALAYAYGKSSSATSNLESEEYEIKEFPLNWDERHALNTYFTIVYGRGETLFDIPYTDNWTLSFSSDFGSGKPFTPTPEFYDGRVLARDIEANSERMPWTTNTDMKLTKSFNFTGENNVSYGRLRFEFDVYNLFNKVNPVIVYPDSGKWDRRSSAYYEQDGRIIAGTENLVEIWRNPTNIRERRHFRFGVSYHW